MLRNVLATDNSLDSGVHTREVLVVILLQSICLGNGCINLGVISILVFQGSNRIFDSLRHLIHFGLLRNVLATDNSLHGIFHIREILVVILLQSICLCNGCINLCVVSILVLQGSNRIFDSLCHLVYFGLLRNIFTTDNSLDSSFHTGEVLIVILVQGICLGNGFINLSVISPLVLQGCNRIFDRFRHCIHFGLLRNVLVTDNSIHCGFHTGEVLIVILVQGIRLGNGFVNLSVISPLVLQGCNRIFDCFRHLIHFGLLRNVLVTHNSVDSGFYSGEIFVVILVQGICLGNSLINLSVISPLVLQSCNRIFNCLCHCIHFGLLGNVLVTDNGIHSSFHTGEVLIVILVQGICLGNGFINLSVVSILVLQSCNRIFDSICHLVYFGLLRNILTTHNGIHSGFHTREVLVVVLV